MPFLFFLLTSSPHHNLPAEETARLKNAKERMRALRWHKATGRETPNSKIPVIYHIRFWFLTEFSFHSKFNIRHIQLIIVSLYF